MAYNVNPLVYHGVARPTWMEDGRFWYRDSGPDGVTFIVVDPVKGTKKPAFDQVKAGGCADSVDGWPDEGGCASSGDLGDHFFR